ncbi:transmembrane emp24 domain-containing protein 3-like [Daphnia pulex]|uniref:GOLD domain-containing protein n=1 Tax=Daphnia pulex TaxID=6669 RepID=E9H223_DAPPU|nr:transmembrane emp24 domain-containing protein 3-like [Daphnia pulex]XP_046656925.1 transmembrane emp24 domain-containing protein 3-like [Daphnia pulicaria]EFX74208.1 hypothetical protein DAPPUDRAFT_307415 [Daphnia pulex]|eukprot:EFX74208.1 hypothetical protein DAPPUDRAFT_307415 [Daphnia pulex]
MNSYQSVISLFFFLLCISVSLTVELTFELPDNARECFYEEIESGTDFTVEFQVVTGGHYDIDFELIAPNKEVLYREVKKQYDSFSKKADVRGVYAACFSNEFSTFSHKLVYVDWQVGTEDPLPGLGEHLTAMTQMESSSHSLHENLNKVVDYQTHHRLRESQGRKRAEDLNERVFLWAVGETIAIIVIGIGQVVILRNFFSEKKPSQMMFS